MDAQRWQHIRAVFEACMELPLEQRGAFLDQECEEDEGCRSEVEALLKASETSSSFLEDTVSTDSLRALDQLSDFSRIGVRIGAYRIIRKLGQGGMATVYLAERADGYYEQQVAIKLVEKAVYRSDLVERFGHERRILATLNHPHIAKLIDGGVTESGIPYLILEYVDGQTLLEYCDQNKLSIAERLKLFCTICDAVHHAHQNLIIHRDLKPSNILVSQSAGDGASRGEIKLLDFGVAKLLTATVETEEDVTIATDRPMTLAYASPEQFKGGSVTTASDVYSLGVILFELLSGIRPYELKGLSPGERERLVLDGAIPKPNQAFLSDPSIEMGDVRDRSSKRGESPEGLVRQIRGDLDTIVSKALSKEPKFRYVSVAQFGEDIERYLGHLPVIARPLSIKYRMGKFVRRHRVGVSISVFVLIALLLSIAVTRHQAQVAERNASQIRRLANSLLFEMNDKVRDLPGATDVRRTLVTHALTYLENLSLETGHDPTLQLELAEAYEQAGRIQGDPHYTNLGDLFGTLKSYQKALTLRESIWKSDSSQIPLRVALANNYGRLAVVTSWCCDNKEAIILSKRALQLMEPVRLENPENIGIRHDWARLQSELSWWYIWEDQIDKGLEILATTTSELEELSEQLPQLVDVQHHLWRAYSYQIDGLKFSGRHAKALDLLIFKAIPHLDGVVKRYPNHPLLMYDLHNAYLFLGEMQHESGQTGEALRSYEMSLKTAEGLAASDSTNRKALEAVAYANTAMGRAESALGNTKKAIGHMVTAVDIRRKLFASDSLNLEVGNAAGNASRALCRVYLDVSLLEDALFHCQESSEIFYTVVSTSYGGPIVTNNYASSCAFTARIYMAMYNREVDDPRRAFYRKEAITWFERAISIMKKFELSDENRNPEVPLDELIGEYDAFLSQTSE